MSDMKVIEVMQSFFWAFLAVAPMQLMRWNGMIAKRERTDDNIGSEFLGTLVALVFQIAFGIACFKAGSK